MPVLRAFAVEVGKKVTPLEAQPALESLRLRLLPLVWKSHRNYYTQNTPMHHWHQDRLAGQLACASARYATAAALACPIALGALWPRLR